MRTRNLAILSGIGLAGYVLYGGKKRREPFVTDLDIIPRTDERPDERDSIQFIGTATTLIRCAGFRILTDPNFLHKGDHVHLGFGLTSERLTDPAVELDTLPPLDFIVLSHMHEDHFDRFVERRLNRSIPILAPTSAARKLRHKGFRRVYGLDTWDAVNVVKGSASVRVTAMPAQHAPTPMSAIMPATMGSMLDFRTTAEGKPWRLYISGDTLIHEELREIPRRFAGVDVGLFHLGGTRVFGVLVTMDAWQGIQAIRIVDPKLAIPIHYNDYTVFKSPLEDFMAAAERWGLADRVRYLRHGETFPIEAGFAARTLTSRP